MTTVSDALDRIDGEIGFIYDHEEQFLSEFTKFNSYDLIEVSFTKEKVKFVFITFDGDSVCYDTEIDRYLKWKDMIIGDKL